MTSPPAAGADLMAFPSHLPKDCRDAQGMDFGLTKREYIASQFMAGIGAHLPDIFSVDFGPSALNSLAGIAVRAADALLKELSK